MDFRVNVTRMFVKPMGDRKNSPVRIISYGLVFAIIFFFSLHAQLDSVIAKVSHSSIAKINKDFKSYHSKQPGAALIPALVDWTPKFHRSFLIVFYKQTFLDAHLLGSRQTRAPPSPYSL